MNLKEPFETIFWLLVALGLVFFPVSGQVRVGPNQVQLGSDYPLTGEIDLGGGKIIPPKTVVGSLPTASSNTDRVYVVTDGTSSSDCTTGGGSTRALCISDGTNWVALGGGGDVDSVFGRTGTIVAETNDYTWAQLNKTTSDIAEITTRSHSSLQSLLDDDHTQYGLLVGRSGGQTYIGGTGAGDDLTLQTTSDVTKGSYIFSELDCSGNANGGALTTDANGVVTCSDDDSGGGGSSSLNDLDDVTLTSETTDDILIKGAGDFVNESLLAAIGSRLTNDRIPFTSGGVLTDDANLTWDGSELTLGGTSELRLPLHNDAATPTLSFGDGDTGFYQNIDNEIVVSMGGQVQFHFDAPNIFRTTVGPVLQGVNRSSTSPTIATVNTGALNDGLNSEAAGSVNVIAGGQTLFLVGGSQTTLCKDPTATTGVTECIAQAGSGQGSTPISSWLNNAGDDLFSISPTGDLIFEGATADGFETTVTVTDPTADRTFTLPNADSNPVQPLTCSGTDKVSAISAAGVITCSADETGAGGGDAVSVNGSAATDANFIDTAASGTVPSITWNLNTTPSPDDINISAIGVASATEAGILTTGAQTLAGNKTFNGTVEAGTLTEGGNAVPNATDHLGFFAATTSAQLAGVLSDETGTGAAVFASSPALTTPTIGDFTNATHNHQNAAGGGTLAKAALPSAIAYEDEANIFTLANTFRRNSLGTTSTDGAILENTTAASSGAQQISPRLRLTGQGWKTDATAASQTVDWALENLPVEGAANPSSDLRLQFQVNAGGYTDKFVFRSNGTFSGSADGSLGINQSNPQEILHISRATTGSTAARFTNTGTGHALTDGLYVGYDSGGFLWNYENTVLEFATNDTARLDITAGGDVEILTGSLMYNNSANVASGATTALPQGNVFHITGTTNITTLNTCDAANNGRLVTLIFDGALTFTDGNNLKLAGDFVTTADDTIQLICDSANWYETSRSVN